jgi:hypothetical protein
MEAISGNYKSASLLEENDWSTMNDIPPTVSQFQTAAPIAFVSNNISTNITPSELDDPTAFRQQLLDHHHRRQHEQTITNHDQQDQTYVDNINNQQLYFQPNRRRIHRRELNNNTSLNLFESKPVFSKRKY